jgi:hypothetical protein
MNFLVRVPLPCKHHRPNSPPSVSAGASPSPPNLPLLTLRFSLTGSLILFYSRSTHSTNGRNSLPTCMSPAASPAHLWKQLKKPIKPSSSPHRDDSHRILAVTQKSPKRHWSKPPARLIWQIHLSEPVWRYLVHPILFRSNGIDSRSEQTGTDKLKHATCQHPYLTRFKLEFWIWILSNLWKFISFDSCVQKSQIIYDWNP